MKRQLLLLIFLLASKFIFSQSADELIEMADAKFDQKDYKYALVLIEKAIALNDTNQKWYYLKKSEIEFKLYGPMVSIQTLKDVLKTNKNFAEAYNRAGTFYSSAGYADSAIMMYNLALKYTSNGDSLKYYYLSNRGTAKAAIRDFAGAAKDYEKVLAFNPTDIATLNNISEIYDEMEMKDKAIITLKKIITLDSTFIGPYVNLGFIYAKIDSLKLSIDYFGKALAIDPNEALVYSNRGNTYYKMGEYDKALDDINYSIRLYPTNSYAYRNLALVHIATKNIKDACTALNFAVFYGFEERYGPEVSELLKKYCPE